MGNGRVGDAGRRTAAGISSRSYPQSRHRGSRYGPQVPKNCHGFSNAEKKDNALEMREAVADLYSSGKLFRSQTRSNLIDNRVNNGRITPERLFRARGCIMSARVLIPIGHVFHVGLPSWSHFETRIQMRSCPTQGAKICNPIKHAIIIPNICNLLRGMVWDTNRVVGLSALSLLRI